MKLRSYVNKARFRKSTFCECSVVMKLVKERFSTKCHYLPGDGRPLTSVKEYPHAKAIWTGSSIIVQDL